MSETTTDIDALIEVIRHGIAQRGFDLLTDDRLKLICGGDYNPQDLSSKRSEINAFAKKHGLCAQIHEGTVMFFPPG